MLRLVSFFKKQAKKEEDDKISLPSSQEVSVCHTPSLFHFLGVMAKQKVCARRPVLGLSVLVSEVAGPAPTPGTGGGLILLQCGEGNGWIITSVNTYTLEKISSGTAHVVMSSCYSWPKENSSFQIYKSIKKNLCTKCFILQHIRCISLWRESNVSDNYLHSLAFDTRVPRGRQKLDWCKGSRNSCYPMMPVASLLL